MTQTAMPSTFRALRLIGGGVFIELTRRKDAYVLMLLMLLFLVAMLAVKLVGVETAATGTFLLNLGMTMAVHAAHVLTLLLAARQIPDEIEHRTLYPLLAKPVSRDTLLTAKWLACALCGTLVLCVLLVLGWVPAPRLEAYSTYTLLQVVCLLPFSLALIAALATWLSLMAPRAVALMAAGALYFAGPALLALVRQHAVSREGLRPLVWLTAYLPDFSKLNLVTRYTDGIGPLAAAEFLSLAAYASIFILILLFLAGRRFRRRPL